MKRFSMYGAAVAAIVLAAQPAARAGVGTVAWEFDTTARERVFENEIIDPTAALPFDQTTTAVQGGSMAQSDYDVDGLAGGMNFAFEFDHMPSWYRGQTISAGFIEFSIDAPSPFSITGDYELIGRGTSDMMVELVELDEVEHVVFASHQVNKFDPEVTLVIGGMDGDQMNLRTGAPEGLLDAGTYRFEYKFSRKHDMLDYLPGTGQGELHFSVTPEPATLGLLVTGALALARRKRGG